MGNGASSNRLVRTRSNAAESRDCAVGVCGDPIDLELSHSRYHDRGKLDLAGAGEGQAVLTEVLSGVAPAQAEEHARRLLANFGTIGQVFAASSEAQMRVVADRAVTRQLQATRAAIAQVLRVPSGLGRNPPTGSELVRSLWVSLAFQDVESVIVMFLDRRGYLLAEEEMARGSHGRAELEPRSIIRRALDLGAGVLVVAHNHPSGDPGPSQEDRLATDTLVAAARLFNIRVQDHLIISRTGWSSLRRLGWLAP
jgi:DNA repair protein RadC